MIEKQPFGRTGRMSTRTIFGAWAFFDVTQAQADRTLELLLRHGVNHIDTVAVQTIKSIARRWWEKKPATRNTGYQPLEDQPDVDKAVHWVLGRPGIFLNTVGDVRVLPKVLDAASRFQAASSDEEMKELVAKLEMEPLWV